ncbi:FAD-dependent oxidoreductase [Pseudonocardiaceae bacterium YIM PH 21723]|nr:FAD-dependent oxidoreductase [Pseudonocardiaceae bacterium YIM PH 21723]
MRGTKVLISGASIAGPALAFWLVRYGAEVTVVEQAPALRLGGQLVDVRGVAGHEVLARSDLAEAVRAVATGADGLSLVGADGRRQASTRSEDFGGNGAVAGIEILRGRLSTVFYEATHAEVEYVFGDRIVALDDRVDGVHVTFQRGQQRVFDVVIGADGLHSGVRGMLLGPEQQLLRHLGMYLSYWTADNHLGLRNWTDLYSEPGRTIGMRAINDNTAVMAMFAFNSAAFDYNHRDLEALKAVVRSHAAGMGWEADRLIAQIDDAGDFYFDSAAQVLLPAWSRGRVGLVGDAAYCASPLSGHGTTIALVGAYVLAGELATAGGDPVAGLRAYESRLRPWIDRVQRFGRGNGKTMTPRTRFGIEFRRTVMRLQQMVPDTNFLLRGQVRLSDGFDLPDYSRFDTRKGALA